MSSPSAGPTDRTTRFNSLYAEIVLKKESSFLYDTGNI
jgi:hypothetical protein